MTPYTPTQRYPTFRKTRGCTAFLRGDKNFEKEIDYGSQMFKELFNERTTSGRIFS
jgi:hypothetical protein